MVAADSDFDTWRHRLRTKMVSPALNVYSHPGCEDGGSIGIRTESHLVRCIPGRLEATACVDKQVARINQSPPCLGRMQVIGSNRDVLWAA